MADLEVQTAPIEKVADGAILTLSGAIDAATALPFKGTLEDLSRKGVRHVILDMEGIKFVNSTGLGCLVQTADQTRAKSGTFTLAKVHPKVKIVFSTLGLDAYFRITRSIEEACDLVYEATGVSALVGTGVSRVGTQISAPAVAPKAAPRAPARRGTGVRGAIAAYVAVPPTLGHAKQIDAHIQAACLKGGVQVQRVEGPSDAWKQSPGALAASKFVIADFSAEPATGQISPGILDLVTHAKTGFKPPKPVLCVVRDNPGHVPAPWNARPFITYQETPAGVKQLQAKVEAAIKRALPRLR